MKTMLVHDPSITNTKSNLQLSSNPVVRAGVVVVVIAAVVGTLNSKFKSGGCKTDFNGCKIKVRHPWVKLIIMIIHD